MNFYCISFLIKSNGYGASWSFDQSQLFLLYYIVSLLTEPVKTNVPIISNTKTIENVQVKINTIYRQIKKNEERPETDYLFNNKMTGRSNIEKTVEKLDKLKNMETFIPRKE